MNDDIYGATIDRMENNIAAVDTNAALASIAISLRRIADALDANGNLSGQIYDGIYNAIRSANPK